MLSQTDFNHWSFQGQYTTGQIDQIRDGLVTRYIAKNSNLQHSPMYSNVDRAELWLKINDRRTA